VQGNNWLRGQLGRLIAKADLMDYNASINCVFFQKSIC